MRYSYMRYSHLQNFHAFKWLVIIGFTFTLGVWWTSVSVCADTGLPVRFSISSDWGSGFQAEVEITNTSGKSIEDWTIAFDFTRSINTIWNAYVAGHTGLHYVIKHPSWATTIPVGGRVSFGFIGSPGGVSEVPTSFTIKGNNTEIGPVPDPAPDPTPDPAPDPAPDPVPDPGSGIQVKFSRTCVWDTGYNAQIDITNNSSQAINGWLLEFDLADTITTLWNGKLQPGNTSGNTGHYKVKNESWNGTISPGGTVSIGFGASINGTCQPPSGFSFNGSPCEFESGTTTEQSGGSGSSGSESGGSESGWTATPAIIIEGIDNQGSPVDQFTIEQGVKEFTLSVTGGKAAELTVATNNPSVATPAIINGINGLTTLRITTIAAGRTGLRITDAKSKAVRYVGLRVRQTDGSLPGLPDHLAIGSVSEDTDTDLKLWRSFGTGATNTRVDMRYIYLCGGPFNGWYDWSGGNGNRVVSFIRESKKLGMIPYFVFYNIPDGGESYYTNLQHIQDAAYMSAYFDNLMKALRLIKKEGDDDKVGMILEPDFIGYLMQLSGRQPGQIMARVHAAYDQGILVRGADPAFPDTVTGLVSAINYLISREAPNVVFGWQFNLWASLSDWSGIPSTGLMRITDSLGIEAGRARIRQEAQKIADYYIAAGVLTYGAHFVSIDKYGLDGGFSGAAAPWNSTWFWNAIHWNNYLLFSKGLHERTGLPVVLWQIPVGHINRSLAFNPYAADGVFPLLTNSYQRYEDSAPTFFLGDHFTTDNDTGRFQYFSQSDPHNPASVSVSSGTVIWKPHMTDARDAGVTAVLFGDGVGESTHGRGSPPADGYWWISKVQTYYEHPVPLIH